MFIINFFKKLWTLKFLAYLLLQRHMFESDLVKQALKSSQQKHELSWTYYYILLDTYLCKEPECHDGACGQETASGAEQTWLGGRWTQIRKANIWTKYYVKVNCSGTSWIQEVLEGPRAPL